MLAGVLTLSATSCKEEKKSEDIVAKMPAPPKKETAPQKRPDSHWSQVVDWHGGKYTIRIDRTADTTLVSDDSGQKFYDNHATVQVIRADGSVFFDKTYRKADFKEAAHGQYEKNGAFLGMTFVSVENDKLVFGASIGDPNPDSDEFVPFSIEVTPTGEATIKESTLGVNDEEPCD